MRRQPVVHADETGWSEDKELAWLWIAVSKVATVFTVARSRGGAVAREILGDDFAGCLVSDRWNAYNWLSSDRRQLCWSHLLRDLEGMIERPGIGAQLASKIRAEAEKMFDWWAQVRDGSLARWDFQVRMHPVRAEIGRLLRDASARAEPKTAGMCAEILKLEPALWTFVRFEGVDPTNNAAERAIRPAVLWCKGSFGNDSAAGSRFTERILTAVATLRQHGADVLRYLADACAATRQGSPPPSLIALAAGG